MFGLGMVKHWFTERDGGWAFRAIIDGVGAFLTTARGRVVASISWLTAAGIEAADVSFRERWEQWHPNVPLITLRSTRRSIAMPIVKYLCDLEAKDTYHKLVVLIPEVQPPRFWEYLLFNQRGAILDRAIRRGTASVVLCRLRYPLEQFAPGT